MLLFYKPLYRILYRRNNELIINQFSCLQNTGDSIDVTASKQGIKIHSTEGDTGYFMLLFYIERNIFISGINHYSINIDDKRVALKNLNIFVFKIGPLSPCFCLMFSILASLHFSIKIAYLHYWTLPGISPN